MSSGFLFAPLFLKGVSADNYGSYLAIQGVIQILLLGDFGFTGYVSKIFSGRGVSSVNEFRPFHTIQLLFSVSLCTIGYSLRDTVPDILGLEDPNSEIANLFGLLWLGVSIKIGSGALDAFIRALGLLTQSNFANTARFILANTFALFGIHYGFGILSFGYGFILASLIFTFYLATVATKHVGIGVILPKIHDFPNIKQAFIYTFKFQAIRASFVAKESLFVILITSSGGPLLLAKYALTTKVPAIFPAIFGKFFSNYVNFYASLFNNSDNKRVQEVFSSMLNFSCALALMIISGLHLILPSFVGFWVGEDLLLEQYYLIIVLLITFLKLIITSCGIILQASGKFGLTPIVSAFEILTLIVFHYLLIDTKAAIFHLMLATSIVSGSITYVTAKKAAGVPLTEPILSLKFYFQAVLAAVILLPATTILIDVSFFIILTLSLVYTLIFESERYSLWLRI